MAARRVTLTATQSSSADFGAGTHSGLDVTTVPGAIQLPTATWWDSDWQYRAPLTVSAGSLARTDFPIEVPIDFPTLLSGTGSTLDENSVRVIEVTAGGAVIGEVPSRYDAGTAAKNGYLVFLMSGSTAASASRHYHVYFDTVANGSKSAPAYYTGTLRRDLGSGNNLVSWGGIAATRHGGLTDLPLMETECLFRGTNFCFERNNKVSSSDGDYATKTNVSGASITIANNMYTKPSGWDPTVLIFEPRLKVIRTRAQAGNLALRQYIILTTGGRSRVTYAIENTGSASITSGMFISGGDYDVGGTETNDVATWDSTDGIIWARDASTNHNIGIRAVQTHAAFQADYYQDIYNQMRLNALDNTPSSSADIGLALAWNLPTLAPADRTFIQESLGFSQSSSGYSSIAPDILNLSTPPTQTLGARETHSSRSGTFTSSVLDAGSPGRLWQTLTYTAVVPAGTSVQFETRTGETGTPDGTWSAWSAPIVTSGASVTSPAGRYLQYRVTLSGQSDSAMPRLDDVTFTYAGLPNQLVFTTPTRVFYQGSCSGSDNVITVLLQDSSGLSTQAEAGGQSFTMTSSSTGPVTWYTDAGCTSEAAGGTFTIPNGSSSVDVYYRDDAVGAPTLTLSNVSGLTNPTAQTHAVIPVNYSLGSPPFSEGTNAGTDITTVPGAIQLAAATWWNPNWNHRVSLTVGAGALTRTDFPVEVLVDFPALLSGTGSTLDGNSVRVIEVDSGGAILGEVNSRYDEGIAAKNGYLIFPMTGTTAAGASRHYHVYFDTVANGPKSAPAYYANTASTGFTNETIGFGGFTGGRGLSGSSLPLTMEQCYLGAALETDNGQQINNLCYSLTNKVYSSDGDYSPTVTTGDGDTLAASAYTKPTDWSPTLLVNASDLKVVRMLAQAGNLHLRRYIALTSGIGSRVTFAIENTGGGSITSGRFIEGSDFDSGIDGRDDVGAWNATDGIAWLRDGFTPRNLGIRAVQSHSAFQVDNRSNVWRQMGANALNGTTSYTGDVGIGLEWTLPTLAPTDRTLVQQSLAISYSSAGYSSIAPTILNLSNLPTQTLGTRQDYAAQTATHTSAVIDGGTTGVVWQWITYTASTPAGTSIQFETRTGAVAVPDGTWSAWSAPGSGSGSAVTSPAGRYLQYRLTLTGPGDGTTPRAQDVDVHYEWPGTHLAFTVQPPDAQATAALSPAVQVSVLDDNESVVTSSTAEITLALTSNPGLSTLSGDTVVNASSGVATFSDLSLNKSGSGYTLTASATGLSAATSDGFDIAAGDPTKLSFTVEPSSAVAGEALAPSLQVSVLDANDNLVTGTGLSVVLALSSNPGGSTLSGTTTQTASFAGVATFADLSLNRTAIGYALSASAAGLASDTSASFNITAGSPTKLGFTVQPSGAVVSTAISPGVEVAVQDALGNTVPTATDSITVAVGTNPSGGALGGTTTQAASSGVATFSNLTLSQAGAGYTLTAAATGRTGATSSGFNIFSDPDITVTSGADFALGGNNETAIDFGATDITRSTMAMGVGAWSSTTGFSAARERHASVVYNGRLYVLGGTTGSAVADVQHAVLNADGTTGSFATTTALPSARFGHAAVAYNGFIYVLGGEDGTRLNDVHFAKVNADGTLGAWTSTTSFGTARSGHASVAANGYLYVIGGDDGSTRLTEVRYAPLRGDGTVGTWASATGFSTGRERHAAVVYNEFLYVLGGTTGAAPLDDVQRAALQPDGSLGNWSTTTALSSARQGHAAVATGGYLYILGGLNASSARLDEVLVSRIHGTGSLGPWTATSTFTAARDGHTSISYKGFLYVVGGTDGGSRLSTVQVAPLGQDALLPPAWSTSTSLPAAVYIGDSVAYNGYVYLVGGKGALGETRYARINSDGTVGAWNLATPLGVDREAAAVAAYNNHLYVLGGREGSTHRNTVHFAPILADGSLGSWSTTATFTDARRLHQAIAHNGYLYVMGGENGTTAYNTVQYAPINSDGTIGAWTSTNAFATARACFGAETNGNYMYVIGGSNGRCNPAPGDTASIQVAPINPDGSLGVWGATTPLPLGMDTHNTVVHNNRLFVVGGYDEDTVAPLASVYSALFHSDGSLGSFQALTSLPTPVYWAMMAGERGRIFNLGGSINDDPETPTTATHSILVRDGTLGDAQSWSAGTSFTTPRAGHSAAAREGSLYVLGGYGGTYLNDVQRASVDETGAVGSWTATTGFATPRADHASVICRGFLYVTGGYDGAARLTDVQFAPIDGAGAVGSWTSTTSLGAGRERHALACHDNFLYALGGYDGASRLNDVLYAPVNANGTLGAWASTSSFTTARERLSAVVYDGYLYILGGSDGTTRLANVQVAPIQANGTLGTWRTVPGFRVRRENPTAVAYGGHLYVIGGTNGSYQSSVEVAPFLSGGSLGTWGFTAPLSTARSGHTAVAERGRLFVLGGTNGTVRNDVEVAELATPRPIGVYSRLIDLGTPSRLDAVTLNGTSTRKGTVSLKYRAAPNSGVFGSLTDLGNVALASSVALDGSHSRYLWLQLTLDDEEAVLALPASSFERDITDLMVAATADVTAPTAPGTPSITPNPTAGPLTVSWTASTDVGGSGVQSYDLEASTDGGDSWTSVTTVTVTSHSYTPVRGTYVFRARARDEAGNVSSYSPNSVAVRVGQPASLRFTTTERAFPVAGCGGAANVINVELLDVNGDPVTAGAGGQAFTMASTSTGTKSWFTDATCSTPAVGGTYTIPAGSSSVGVYYQDTAVGSPSLSLTNGSGLANPSAQVHRVVNVRFADDFESGTLLTSSAGKWDYTIINDAANSVTASSAAAHRGNYGVRAVDGRNITGSGIEAQLGRPASFVANSYVRYWFRLTSSNSLGTFIQSGSTWESRGVFSLEMGVPAETLQCAGYAGATYVRDSLQPGFSVGTWYLVEKSLTGIGTTNGVRKLWINGTLVSTSAALNLTGMAIDNESVGVAWSTDRQFVGTVDVDDYRSDSEPHASHFSLSTAASGAAGSCNAVTVTLRDSVSDSLAPAPYDFSASLGVSGVNGAFFSDSGCGTSTSAVDFSTGADTRTVYFQPTSPGTATLTASHVDFVDGSTSMTTTFGPADKLTFTVQPSNSTGGSPISPSVQVTVQDEYGNTVTSSGLSITVAIGTNPASGTLSGTTVQNASSGVATFSGLSINTAGVGYTLTAAASGVDAATSTTFDVTAGPAAKLAFTTPARIFPQSECASAVNVVRVQLQDAGGNAVNAGVGGQALTVGSNSGGTKSWFADASCSTPAPGGGFTIQAGSSTVDVYYQDSAVGTPRLSLSNSSGLDSSTTQLHEVRTPQFSDDFELGVLLKSASGRWDSENLATGNTIAADAGAARRGSYGLRVVDSRDVTGPNSGSYIAHAVPGVGRNYVRYWVRVTSSNGLGQIAHTSEWSDLGVVSTRA